MKREISFYKYHGAGNDFIMVDARAEDESLFTTGLVKQLCDRHTGIGADGLILLLPSDDKDFHMKYFNSDGNESTMCGNGGRCITVFARDQGIIKDKAIFTGIDGDHIAYIRDNLLVRLKMIDVDNIIQMEQGYFLNTGSPHFVLVKKDIENLDVFNEGRTIRHWPDFAPGGANVNFIEMIDKNEIAVRTYERGVENETLSCGTGSVASAITSYFIHRPDKSSYTIHTRGGKLKVSFQPGENNSFTDIWLEGPAEYVFKGEVLITKD